MFNFPSELAFDQQRCSPAIALTRLAFNQARPMKRVGAQCAIVANTNPLDALNTVCFINDHGKSFPDCLLNIGFADVCPV